MSLSEDALVAVCLCTRLGRGERVEPLGVREWSDLVRTITRDGQATPRDLLDGDASDAKRILRVIAQRRRRLPRHRFRRREAGCDLRFRRPSINELEERCEED